MFCSFHFCSPFKLWHCRASLKCVLNFVRKIKHYISTRSLARKSHCYFLTSTFSLFIGYLYLLFAWNIQLGRSKTICGGMCRVQSKSTMFLIFFCFMKTIILFFNFKFTANVYLHFPLLIKLYWFVKTIVSI